MVKTKNVKVTKSTANVAVAIVALAIVALYARSGGKTANAASVKKVQATSQPIFKPKRPISSPQGRFLWKDEETDSDSASFRDFNGSDGVKTIRQPSYSPDTATADIFLFQRLKSKPGDLWLSRPYDEPGGGHLNQHQKQFRCRLLAVGGPLHTIRPNPCQGGLKKSQNSKFLQ